MPYIEIVVLHHGKFNAETGAGVFYFGQRFLPGKFRRVDADDGQASWFVLIMPTPQLRDDVSTVDSAIGPKLDQDNPAFEGCDGERFAVDPVFAGEFRRRRAVGKRRAGARPSRPKRQRKNERH